MTLSTSDWEKKWRLMIDKDNNRKIQNEILSQNLRTKKEFEESIECTFQPNLSKIYLPGLKGRRSKDELLRLLLPIISEEESILMELSRIDFEEENNRRELSDLIISTFHKSPSQSTDYFLNFYRDERLNDVSKSKNLKLEVVGKLQELERNFNILCSRESISSSELKSVGFDISICKNIKYELLRSLDNHESLKNRYRVTSEFDEIMRNINLQLGPKSHHDIHDLNRHNNLKDSRINHYSNHNVSHMNYRDMDSKNHFIHDYGQYSSPQMTIQQPSYNQHTNQTPSYNQLSYQPLSYNQHTNQTPSYNQLSYQPLSYNQHTNQTPSYNQLSNQPLSYNQHTNQTPIYNHLHLRNPQLSHTLQHPIKHSYGFNRSGHPVIPSSNNGFMTNLKDSKGNLGNYRQFSGIENNPFLVK